MTEPGVPGAGGERPRLRARRAALRSRRWRFRAGLVVMAVYLALAFLPFRAAWSHDPSTWLPESGGADIGQSAFFLAQFPYAIVHHVNPLANTWTNWPFGANYMNNTSIPLLAALMTPVTVLGSPVLALNVLFVLTVWLNCVVAFRVVLRFSGSLVASFFAGLIYGFSPVVTAAELGHVHVMFDVLPPLMFLLLYKLCAGEGSPVRTGVLLGICLAGQLYVFPEPLVDCVILAAIGLLTAAFCYRGRVRERLPGVLRGSAAAVGTFLVLGAYGVYELLAGPFHPSGTLHPTKVFSTLSADLLSPVLPASNQRFTLGLGRPGTRLVGPTLSGVIHPDGAENGTYVGIALLAVLVVGLLFLWRRHLVRMTAFLAVVSFVFSLGSRLRVDDHLTPVRLPFDVLRHLPIVDNLIASRFAMQEWFFLVLLLGLVLAGLGRWVGARRPWSGSPPAARVVSGVVMVVVALVALVPLTPRWRNLMGQVALPSLAVGAQVRSLPTGEVVLGYPFPTGNTHLMVWQAEDRMRFRIVGAQLIQSGIGGGNQASSAPASVTQSLLKLAYAGSPAPGLPLPPVTVGQVRQVAREMQSWHVGAVLWTDLGADPAYALGLLTRVLGSPSVRAPDSVLWLSPAAQLSRRAAS